MRSFERRKKIKKFLYSRVTAVLLLVAIIFLSRAVWSVYKSSRFAKQNLEISHIEKEELQDRVLSLETDINNFETDTGLEKALREKYNVIKEGEEVIVLVNDDDLTATSGQGGQSIWRRIINWFK